MDSIAKIVGENILIAREAAGLSQADVAQALKIKPQTVYRWEKGRSWPTSKNIESLSSLFGADPSELFRSQKPPGLPRSRAEDPKIKAALALLCRFFGYKLSSLKAGRRT